MFKASDLLAVLSLQPSALIFPPRLKAIPEHVLCMPDTFSQCDTCRSFPESAEEKNELHYLVNNLNLDTILI